MFANKGIRHSNLVFCSDSEDIQLALSESSGSVFTLGGIARARGPVIGSIVTLVHNIASNVTASIILRNLPLDLDLVLFNISVDNRSNRRSRSINNSDMQVASVSAKLIRDIDLIDTGVKSHRVFNVE